LFTNQINQLVVLFLFLLTGLGCQQNEFENAILKAKSDKLIQVNQPGKGVSFYSKKNLDPIWDSTADVVKVPKLKLQNQSGVTVDESLFENKITFVAFFFSSCAGFCSITIKNLQQIESDLKNYKNVQFIGITVDPEKDSPAQLQKYFKSMKLNSKTWNLLTGNKNTIYKFAQETMQSEVFVLPKSKGQISHSEKFYVIDPELRLRGVIKGTRLDASTRAVELIYSLTAEESKKVSAF
jgi:protein SCO1/2